MPVPEVPDEEAALEVVVYVVVLRDVVLPLTPVLLVSGVSGHGSDPPNEESPPVLVESPAGFEKHAVPASPIASAR